LIDDLVVNIGEVLNDIVGKSLTGLEFGLKAILDAKLLGGLLAG
jgi:hypothetical protein